MNQIAVLCAQKKSVYSQLSGLYENDQLSSQSIEVVLYDKKRDARTFRGGCPVIAHPPCRLWSKLAHFSTVPAGDRGAEMDLGRFCAQAVIDNGGILEHPFSSRLFKDMGLPLGGERNELGFTLEIPQRMFGHSMIKNTWLFFSKIQYESLEAFLPVLHEKPLRSMENLSTKQREATPYLLAFWLVKQALKVSADFSPVMQPVKQPVYRLKNRQSCQVVFDFQKVGVE